jgi:hypothetical protein
MRVWPAVVLLSLFGAVINAQEPLPDASKRIASAKVFAFGGIGYAGATSPGEVDFRIITAQPPKVALDTFEKLYLSDNRQTKAYALAGIRKLDKDEFNKPKFLLHSSALKVEIEEGFIVSVLSLEDIAGRLDSGQYYLLIK